VYQDKPVQLLQIPDKVTTVVMRKVQQQTAFLLVAEVVVELLVQMLLAVQLVMVVLALTQVHTFRHLANQASLVEAVAVAVQALTAEALVETAVEEQALLLQEMVQTVTPIPVVEAVDRPQLLLVT
jgi:hypothetical protein